MTKQEQIEEMARIACEHFDYDMVDQPCKKCKAYDKHCYTIHQAEILYNAGYRKLSGDIVAMSKDDLKLYKRSIAEEFIEALKDNAVQCYTHDGNGMDGIDIDDLNDIVKEYLK